MRRGHRERSTASANRCCGHLVSSESCCEVWCSPTRGSLSRFKCLSDTRSTFSCLMWTLAAACDALQVNARMEVFFRDSGKTCHVARGFSIWTLEGSSDVGLFDPRCKKFVLLFSGACVSCGMVLISSHQVCNRTKEPR